MPGSRNKARDRQTGYLSAARQAEGRAHHAAFQARAWTAEWLHLYETGEPEEADRAKEQSLQWGQQQALWEEKAKEWHKRAGSEGGSHGGSERDTGGAQEMGAPKDLK